MKPKPWQLIAVGTIVAAAAAFLWVTGGLSRWTGGKRAASGPAPSSAVTGRPAQMDWHTINRPDDGFKVEMPAAPTDFQVPAYNETGTTEPVRMLICRPDADTTFAISWEDNPPVARVNNRDPQKTLDMARDGMLSRTQTTMVNEKDVTVAGHPGRDITAHNTEGGLLDARLIYTGDRLYTMIAVFPNSGSRRQEDVTRFFGSFAASQMPGTALPEAAAPTH
jgi:hypothetical protein